MIFSNSQFNVYKVARLKFPMYYCNLTLIRFRTLKLMQFKQALDSQQIRHYCQEYSLSKIFQLATEPSEHKMLFLCWFDVGQPSAVMDQY